jgi:hypothetical protein
MVRAGASNRQLIVNQGLGDRIDMIDRMNRIFRPVNPDPLVNPVVISPFS